MNFSTHISNENWAWHLIHLDPSVYSVSLWNGVQMANNFRHLEGILELFTLRYIDGILITVLVAYSHWFSIDGASGGQVRHVCHEDFRPMHITWSRPIALCSPPLQTRSPQFGSRTTLVSAIKNHLEIAQYHIPFTTSRNRISPHSFDNTLHGHLETFSSVPW